jgi:YHS domain-containing protein/thiol-disulfide isomerase/thioredoxin
MKSMLRLLVVLGLTAAVAESAELIPWFTDFQQACELAAEQRRLVLLHFYNDNCEPCRRLEQNVFSQPQVAQAVSQSYVPVKVHAGRNPALATRYQVQRWPTDVIVTPSGLEVFRTISPQKPAEYIALMQQVAQQAGVYAPRGVSAPQSRPAPPAEPTDPAAAPPAWPAAVAQATATRRSAFLQPDESPAQGLTHAQQPALAASAGQPGFSGTATGPLSGPSASATAPPSADEPAVRALGAPSASSWTAPPPVAAATGTPRPTMAPWPSQGGQGPAQMARRVENPWVPRTPQSRDFGSTTEGAAVPGTAHQPSMAGRTNPPGQNHAQAMPAGPWASAPPQPPRLVPASQAPPVALDGFCPVTLVEVVAQDPTDRRAWKKGDPRFGAIHEGRTYLFASAEQQQKFLANPEAYAPVLGGYDPVHLVESGVWVEGKRAYGLITPDQKIYLFADEGSLARFHQFPERYTGPAVQQASAASRAPSFR